MAIHDKDWLLDLLQLAIAVRFGNDAPAGDSICLRAHSRHRRRDILVSSTVTTFPESPSGSLARLARREEEIEKILNCRRLLGRVFNDLRVERVHAFTALRSGAGEDDAADQIGALEGCLLGDEASKRKAKQVNLRQAECVAKAMT